jgi:hypothetical protein
MNNRSYFLDSHGQAQPERRVHERIREVFPAACELLAPLLEQGSAVSSFALARAVRDRFSDLDPLEADMLVAAIRRLQREGQLKAG